MSLPSKELSDRALDVLVTRERSRVVAPLTEWRTLSAQLREEGLLPTAGAGATAAFNTAPDFSSQQNVVVAGMPRPRSGIARWGARLLAGAALVGAGVFVGNLGNGPMVVLKHGAAPRDTVAEAAAAFQSPDEARRVLNTARSDYQRASAYLVASDTSAKLAGNPALYRDRLAALDEVMSATQRALQGSPQDPLLNQYYMSTVGAREATVQRLNQTLPVGSRVSHF